MWVNLDYTHIRNLSSDRERRLVFFRKSLLTSNALNPFKFKTTYCVNISKKLILVSRCSFLTKYAQETFEFLKNEKNGWLLTKIFINRHKRIAKEWLWLQKLKNVSPKKNLIPGSEYTGRGIIASGRIYFKICQIKVSMNCVLRLAGKMILVFTWKLNDTETTCKS